MKHIMYRTSAFILAVLLFVLTPSVRATLIARDLDDTDTYNYWLGICSSQYYSYPTECSVFKKYVADKRTAANDEIAAKQNEIANLKLSMDNIQAEITKVQDYLTTMETQRQSLQADIAVKEAAIVSLQVQIQQRQDSIASYDALIKKRMVAMEEYNSGNLFIQFLLQAQDFADLLSRWDAVSEITDSDRQLVQKLNDEKTALQNDQNQVAMEKSDLEAAYSQNETYIAAQKTAQAQLNSAFYQFQAQQQQAEDDIATASLSAQQSQELTDKLTSQIPPGGVTPSGDWGRPIQANIGFTISAVAWAYPEGGWHAGVDLAPSWSSVWSAGGAPALAPGNGVVIYSYNGCASTNSYYCGDPSGLGSLYGGNQVYMIIDINGNKYGVSYKHLLNGSPAAAQAISSGQVVGKVGNSGQSTGPHLHIEVVFLGTDTLNYYIQTWQNGNFGAPASSSNTRYCSSYAPPCRPNPQDMWGYVLGRSY